MDILTYPVIGFGKHKGKPFNHIPTGYVTWLSQSVSDPFLRKCAKNFLMGIDAPEVRECINLSYNSDNDEIEIESPFELLADIKELSDRRWDKDRKRWCAPMFNFDEIHRFFPKAHIANSLKDMVRHKLTEQVKMREFIGKTETDINIQFDDINLGLYPHQNIAVDFIEKTHGRCILACEQGTGKTIDVIGYMRLYPTYDTIIVCPSIMKNVWHDEIMKWLNIDAVILSGRKPFSLSGKVCDTENDDDDTAWNWSGKSTIGKPVKTTSGKVYIINYEIVSAWADELKTVSAKVLVLDESHYVKNAQSKRTKTLKTLSEIIPNVILLSGTPIMNHLRDLWSQLNIVSANEYQNFFMFAHKYCGAYSMLIDDKKVWDFNGASNVDELADRLQSTIMLRQTKAQVLPDLPDKVRTRVPININKTEYNKLIGDISSMTCSNDLVMATMRAKIPLAIEYIKETLKTVDKLVVFTTHIEMLESICGEFDALRIDGKVHDDHNIFQDNPDKHIIVCNIHAAGVGITLTAASHAIFCELPYTPTALAQAEDRLHRIGAKNSVNYHYVIAKDTVDELVAKMILEKGKVIDQAMLDKYVSEIRL